MDFRDLQVGRTWTDLTESAERLRTDIPRSERPAAMQDRYTIDSRCRHWSDIIKDAGARYAKVSLGNFECPTQGHSEAKEAVRRYIEAMPNVGNMIIIGPVGAGKDHLGMATLRSAVLAWGMRAAWCDAQQLFARIRQSYSDNEPERSILLPLTRADILLISDPVPPTGTLSGHQANILGQVLDHRSRNLLPTVSTMNIAKREELYQQIGPRNADRLCEQCVTVKCNFASYRSRKAAL